MITIKTLKNILHAISGGEHPEDAGALLQAIRERDKPEVLQILSKYVGERVNLAQLKVIKNLITR